MIDLHVLMQALASLETGMPLAVWWLPVAALLVLGGTALFDAHTGRVPDSAIFLGLVLTVATQGFATDWPVASHNLLLGLMAAFVIWGINRLYYWVCKRDALGMGDAKWSILAVANFGFVPAGVAWVIGAWLGLLWLAGIWAVGKICKRDFIVTRIHFAPFLFMGLVAALFWRLMR